MSTIEPYMKELKRLRAQAKERKAKGLRYLDPLEFFRIAVLSEPCEWQRKFLLSDSKRVLLNCCRQSGKSTTSAILATHLAVYTPNSLILLISPSQRQSFELLRKCRSAYVAVGSPLGFEGDSALRLELPNGSRVVSLPASADQIRGFSGPTAILADEASRIPDDTLYAITPMMASNPDCRFITMSTPAGSRGWWWDLFRFGGEKWQKFSITADSVPWITEEFLAEERSRMTEAVFLEEYFCQPNSADASVFDHDDIEAMVTDEFNAWEL